MGYVDQLTLERSPVVNTMAAQPVVRMLRYRAITAVPPWRRSDIAAVLALIVLAVGFGAVMGLLS